MKKRVLTAVAATISAVSVWAAPAVGPRQIAQWGIDGFEFHSADANLENIDANHTAAYSPTNLIARDWQQKKTIAALGVTLRYQARFDHWSDGDVDEGYIWMLWDSTRWVQQLQYLPGYGGLYSGDTASSTYTATRYTVQVLDAGGDPLDNNDWTDIATVTENDHAGPWAKVLTTTINRTTRGVRMKMLDPINTGDPNVPNYHMGQHVAVWGSPVTGQPFVQLQTNGFADVGGNVNWSAGSPFSNLYNGNYVGVGYAIGANAVVPAEGHQMWWQFNQTELLGNVTIIAGGIQNAIYWLDTELYTLNVGGDPNNAGDWTLQDSVEDNIEGVLEFVLPASVRTDGVKLVVTDYYSDYSGGGQTLFGATEVIMLEGGEVPAGTLISIR
jgi:hypothetical protein